MTLDNPNSQPLPRTIYTSPIPYNSPDYSHQKNAGEFGYLDIHRHCGASAFQEHYGAEYISAKTAFPVYYLSLISAERNSDDVIVWYRIVIGI